MHQPTVDRLEDYLRRKATADSPDGTGDPDFKDLEDHLRKCSECRKTVTLMEQQSRLLRVLRGGEVEPPPGFYGRIMNRIDYHQSRPSFWNAFLEPFGSRLVYASLALMVLLATYLVTTEPGPGMVAEHRPEQVLVEEIEIRLPESVVDPEPHRDAVLVTLASFSDSDYE